MVERRPNPVLPVAFRLLFVALVAAYAERIPDDLTLPVWLLVGIVCAGIARRTVNIPRPGARCGCHLNPYLSGGEHTAACLNEQSGRSS